MWALNNRTPYAAHRTWIRDKNGHHLWLVVVKATFSVHEDGSVHLSDEQIPVSLAPEYHGDPQTTGLRCDTDLVAPKPTTDVLANATVYAPEGRAVPAIPLRFRVGEIRKQLVVYGPRLYERGIRGPALSAPQPFVQAPIAYELAYGGTDRTSPDPAKHVADPKNPIGRGFAIDSRTLIDTLAHRIEYLGEPPTSNPPPPGLAPIAPHWSPRRGLAGTFDEHWKRSRRPLLPDDYEDEFLLCSPTDQRPAQHLRGGEPVELINLTPGGVLRFSLPKIYPTFSTFIRGSRREHRARLDTVLIEPDHNRIVMVWHAALPVPSRDVDHVDKTIVGEKDYIR